MTQIESLNLGWWFLILLGGTTIVVFFGQTLLKLFRMVWSISLKVLLGALALFLFNMVGQLIHLDVPLNPITALLVGSLGLPGLITLLIVKLFIIPI